MALTLILVSSVSLSYLISLLFLVYFQFLWGSVSIVSLSLPNLGCYLFFLLGKGQANQFMRPTFGIIRDGGERLRTHFTEASKIHREECWGVFSSRCREGRMSLEKMSRSSAYINGGAQTPTFVHVHACTYLCIFTIPNPPNRSDTHTNG